MLASIIKSNIEIYYKELDLFLSSFLTGSPEYREIILLQLNSLTHYGVKFYFEKRKSEFTKFQFWTYISIENLYTITEIINVEETNAIYTTLINSLITRLVNELKDKLEWNINNRDYIKIIEILVS